MKCSFCIVLRFYSYQPSQIFESVAFSTPLVVLTFGACSVLYQLYVPNIFMVCKSEGIWTDERYCSLCTLLGCGNYRCLYFIQYSNKFEICCVLGTQLDIIVTVT